VAHEARDHCQGHPERTGQYHYHSLTGCLDDGGSGHSALMGYAFDGFGVDGPRGEDGAELSDADLDACHGHTHTITWDGHTAEMYHYHATAEYPYTLGCFKGQPNRQLMGPGTGGPGAGGTGPGADGPDMSGPGMGGPGRGGPGMGNGTGAQFGRQGPPQPPFGPPQGDSQGMPPTGGRFARPRHGIARSPGIRTVRPAAALTCRVLPLRLPARPASPRGAGPASIGRASRRRLGDRLTADSQKYFRNVGDRPASVRAERA